MRMLGTYALKHPIVLDTKSADGTEHEEELKPAGFTITVHRPKGKDLKVFDRHGQEFIAATLEMIERLTQLDKIEADNLDAQDVTELGNLFERFAPSGPPTGETSSAT